MTHLFGWFGSHPRTAIVAGAVLTLAITAGAVGPQEPAHSTRPHAVVDSSTGVAHAP